MGDGYRVDLGAMTSLVSTLQHAEESMTSANDALKDASPQDLGSAGLDSAGKDFQDTWEYGIGKIADLAGKMAGGLGDTLKTYRSAEDSISKLFPASGSGGGGGGPAGNPGSAISARLGGSGA